MHRDLPARKTVGCSPIQAKKATQFLTPAEHWNHDQHGERLASRPALAAPKTTTM